MMNPFVAKAYLPQNSKGEGRLIGFTRPATRTLAFEGGVKKHGSG